MRKTGNHAQVKFDTRDHEAEPCHAANEARILVLFVGLVARRRRCTASTSNVENQTEDETSPTDRGCCHGI
jgi:hypothetical protein